MSILNKLKKADKKDKEIKENLKDEKKVLKKENTDKKKLEKKASTKNDEALNFFGIERSVLKKPHISEKAYSIGEKNQYIFWVDKSANKPMIKREIEMRYNVHVTSVNTLTNKGKHKMFKGRPSKKKITKKAIVTVKQGEKIDIA